MYLSTKQAKELGKANMKLQWGASLLILVIYAGLMVCGNAIPVLGGIVVAGALSYGLTYVYYHASLGKKIEYWDIFKGFENEFGDNFLAGLLIGVFTTLWSLLFVIPGIVKSYAYSMTFYVLMKEPELDAMEAIHKSCEIMKGHKMRLFMIDLSFLGWTILEVLTAGLVGIYSQPYKHHTKMVFFNNVYDNYNNNVEAEPVYDKTAQTNGIDPSLIVDVEPVEEKENNN